jgi:hypothetical protein
MKDALVEELIMLCEIRGEFDDVTNSQIEHKIKELQQQISEFENTLG